MTETIEKSPWQPINTAPKKDPSPSGRYSKYKIDILAKTWLRDEDRFVFIRCTDCFWSFDSGDWEGLESGYRAVAWMPIPVIPKEYP